MNEVVMGIDKGADGGDQTALTLRMGVKTMVTPDPFASFLLKQMDQTELLQRLIDQHAKIGELETIINARGLPMLMEPVRMPLGVYPSRGCPRCSIYVVPEVTKCPNCGDEIPSNYPVEKAE